MLPFWLQKCSRYISVTYIYWIPNERASHPMFIMLLTLSFSNSIQLTHILTELSYHSLEHFEFNTTEFLNMNLPDGVDSFSVIAQPKFSASWITNQWFNESVNSPLFLICSVTGTCLSYTKMWQQYELVCLEFTVLMFLCAALNRVSSEWNRLKMEMHTNMVHTNMAVLPPCTSNIKWLRWLTRLQRWVSCCWFRVKHFIKCDWSLGWQLHVINDFQREYRDVVGEMPCIKYNIK